jgi:CHAT domain-containing protein/tetratricopeptide (TPR) repeat protein
MKLVSFHYSPLFLAVIVAAAWFIPAWGGGEDAVRQGDSLKGKIAVLRAAGDYSEAYALAREAYARASTETTIQNTRLSDLERLVTTLQQIVGLPDTSRVAMARADSLVAVYDSLHMDARYADAMSAVQEALDIQITFLGEDHYEVGLSKGRLAFARQNLDDLDGAEPVYNEALMVLRNSLGESHPDIAEVLDWKGVLYLKQGKYEQSERVLNEALEMYRRFSDASRGIAITLHDRAHLMFLRGDHSGSERVYQEAIEVWRRIGEENTVRCATTFDNLGIVYVTQGRHAEAEPLYRRALELRRKYLRWDHPDVAVSLNNLAGLYYVLGNYVEAAPLYREALAIKRKTLPAGHQSLVLGASNLAAVLFKQGEVEEAEALFEEALGIFKATLPPGHAYIGLVQNNLASVISEQGDYARAESLYTEALSIYRNSFGDKHENVATLLGNIAKVKIEQGDYPGAETRFREALEIYEHQFGFEHPSVASSLTNMGAMMIRQGRYAESEVELRRALQIYDRMLMTSAPGAVTANSLLGSALVQSGDITGGIETLESACQTFEVARRRVSVGGLRRTAYTASESPYRKLAVAYLENGDYAAAWESVENDNGRGLLDMLETVSARDLTEDEIAEEKRLDNDLGRLEDSYIAWANDSTSAGAARADSIRTVLLEAQTRWSRFQRRLAGKYPIAEGRSRTLGEIQSGLDGGSAIVGWLDVLDEHFVYMVPREGPVVWERLAGTQIDSLALRFLGSMTVDPVVAGENGELGRQIYAARMQPLDKHLAGIERIVVIPSGPMLGLPVEALSTGEGEYVVDRWEVSYAPSATIHSWLESKPKRKGDPSLIVLGDPPFNEQQARAMAGNSDAGALAAGRAGASRSGADADHAAIADLKPLGGSRKEATDIAALFDRSDVLLGKAANEANLVERATNDELAGYSFVHLATHAIIDNKRPERSCLVLSQVDLPDPLETVISGGRIIDGRLTMEEILREWRLEANLVTLSACETALGREVRGEGYIGFAHAFFQAGTRSVVVSLWQVDDRATRRLMARFYENMLERDMSRSAALREAKRWLRDLRGSGDIRPFSHPAFWSGFILMGDPD